MLKCKTCSKRFFQSTVRDHHIRTFHPSVFAESGIADKPLEKEPENNSPFEDHCEKKVDASDVEEGLPGPSPVFCSVPGDFVKTEITEGVKFEDGGSIPSVSKGDPQSMTSGATSQSATNAKKSEGAKTGFRFSCPLCTSTFSSRTVFGNHWRKHSLEPEITWPWTCVSGCEIELFSYITIYRHWVYEHTLPPGSAWPFTCHACNKKLMSLHELRRHFGRHVSNLKKTCFDNPVVSVSAGFPTPGSSDSGEGGGKSLSEKALEIPCLVADCGALFSSEQGKQRHMAVSHGIGYNPILNGRNVPCKICGRTFKHSTTYQKHMQLHQNVRRIVKRKTCDVCKQTFSVASELNKHFKRAHPTELLKLAQEHGTVCPECGEAFITYRAVYKHRVEKHSQQSVESS